MRVSSLAVFYLWTNLYTVNYGFLLQPLITLHKRRQSPSSISQRVSQSYARGVKRASTNLHTDTINFIKQKRFFEFHPLAFDRRKFSRPGSNAFLFDSKRFFQYSPFIARLQRSHVRKENSLERPKQTHKPHFYTAVVDHFSGSKLPSDSFSPNYHGWGFKPSRKFEKLANEDAMLENHELNKEKPVVYNHLDTVMKSNRQHQNVFGQLEKSLINAKIKPSPLTDNKVILEDNKESWNTQSLPNKAGELQELYPSAANNGDKLTDTLVQSENKPRVKDTLWGGINMHKSDNHFGSTAADIGPVEEKTAHGDIVFGQHSSDVVENRPSNTDTDNMLVQNDGFGNINNKDSPPVIHHHAGFGDLNEPINIDNNQQSQVPGVWGSFSEPFSDTGSEDAIPVPPLVPLGNEEVSRKQLSGTTLIPISMGISFASFAFYLPTERILKTLISLMPRLV